MAPEREVLDAAHVDGVWTTDPADVLPKRPCPLCDQPRAGYPVRNWADITTSGRWPEPVRWQYRLDLIAWVCPQCNHALGPDLVRESLIAQSMRRPVSRLTEGV